MSSNESPAEDISPEELARLHAEGQEPTKISGLVRDTESGALVRNNVSSELGEYRRRRAAIEENQTKLAGINRVERDVDELKTEMSDIKKMLEQLIRNSNAN